MTVLTEWHRLARHQAALYDPNGTHTTCAAENQQVQDLE